MKLLALVFITCLASPTYCTVFEIWNPTTLKEVFHNKTHQLGEFIQTMGADVGETVSGYIEKAKKQSRDIKEGITSYFEAPHDEFDAEPVEENNSDNKNVSFMNNLFKLNCPYDPDVDLNAPQIIARHGYPVEAHIVITEDGYILTMHRIPKGRGQSSAERRQPVYLHHGLLASSADWIIPGPEKALAYILADAGYDVWMGNVRGNTYSRAHVNLSSSDRAFWNFSWHEVGMYDLPAAIDYINGVTESDKELLYIGHSMGTSILFVLLSTRPEYNNKLKAGFTLAPVAYMSAIKSPIRHLAPFASDFELLSTFLGVGEFLPQNFILKWLAKFGCEINTIEKSICENSMFILCGYDKKEFNSSLLPVIFSHTPAGASTKSVVHFAQEIHAKGKFQMYDYGMEGNLEKYHTKNPPEYKVERITLPIALFTADNDWLSGVSDAKRLYKLLPNPIELYVVPMKEFNHLDFMWGIDAPKLVYKRLMELMNKYKTRKGYYYSLRKEGLKFSVNK